MKPEETLKKPDALTVDPMRVTLNHGGFGWRDYMVRLPEGCIADDLKEPGLWRRVQKGPNALRRHDHLYLVSYDETWSADAIVADANANEAVLCKPRVTTFPERYDRLFEDDSYRIVWMGNGYRVQRKKDAQHVTPLVANAVLAERDLRQMYAVRA